MGHETVATISRENWKRLRNSNDRRQLFEGFDVHVCGAPETPLYGIDSWKNLQLVKRVDMQTLHPCWGKVFSVGYENAFSNSDLDCSIAPPDSSKGLGQVSLLEIVEDIMRGQRGLQHPASESESPSYTNPQRENHGDSLAGGGQCRRFCVNVPYIPLNLEVPLPTLYAFTWLSLSFVSHFLFRDYDDFKCILNRVRINVASDLGSSWLHASQQSAISPWQISAAGLATFIHVCVGSMICFLSHDEINPISHHELNFDKKGCDAVYLQPGDAL